MVTTRRRAVIRTTAVVGALALTLAACSSGGSPGAAGATSAASASSTDGKADASTAPASSAKMQAALEKGGELSMWAWDPAEKDIVAKFQKAYPKVKVDLQNVGTGNDQYTKLQNAIKAGRGIPDVAQVEFYAIPQFAITKSLVDLTPFGAGFLDKTFTSGDWGASQVGGQILGLPQGSGPMVLFYNKAVFDKYKLTVPVTWEEYVADAKKLNAADPTKYITADNGDSGFAASMIWQAGGRPYKVDGTQVSIDFSNPGTEKFSKMWQPLIDQKLLAKINPWTDEWFQALSDGTIATLASGAWMPANLEGSAPKASGDWRVTQMPQYEKGTSVTAQNGGGGLSIMEASPNKDLAYAFLNYAAVGPGAQSYADTGEFPTQNSILNSPAFLNAAPKYFGGQKINQVLSAAAGNVAPGWQYLPFQPYANSIFANTAGQAWTASGTTLQQGLMNWQQASLKYAGEQGFTVK